MDNLMDCISDFIFVDDFIDSSDVILIPGGSHPQLAEKAAKLYKQGMAPYILASGHANPNIPNYSSEAEYLKSIAIDLGVPPEKFLCENKASHTFENAEFSFQMLKNMNIKADKIILVCKAYHSRRTLFTYSYNFPVSTEFLVASVVDKYGLCRNNWYTKPDYISKVMSEVEKIGKYFKDKTPKLLDE
jgi:uncharacterized SAM-binding protein YcdF (DUF218 family)